MFNFDFSNGYVILRIICGLFYIPHIIAKFTAREAVLGFFDACGMKPAPIFRLSALVLEIIMAPCLILGIFTPYVGWVSALFLLVAGAAVIRVTKGKWLWNLGGAEYPFFWAICSAIVAMHAP